MQKWRRGGIIRRGCTRTQLAIRHPAEITTRVIHSQWVDTNKGCFVEFDVLTTCKVISSLHRLVTVCTHGDLIVLPHWEIRLPAPWSDIPLSHIILSWVNKSHTHIYIYIYICIYVCKACMYLIESIKTL